MDELTLMGRSAPDVEPPSAAVLAAARADLLQAAARETAPRWWHRRRVLAPLSVAATVAAVAAAVLAFPATSVGDRAPTARADAAQVLLQAATVARNTSEVTPRADQYVYVRQPGAQVWLSVDGTHDGLTVGSDGTRTTLPGCRNGTQLIAGNYTGLRPQPCTPMPAFQPALPTDADGMVSYLAGDAGPLDPAGVNRIGKQVQYLLSSTYLTAAQRAALFEAVARIPGLEVSEGATGPSGQRGTAVSWDGPGDGDSAVLLFDPASERLLAFYTRAADGSVGGGTAGEPRIVDRAGVAP